MLMCFGQFDPLDEWGQYLVSNTLSPGFQSSTDQFAGQPANQTNLAIKGIISLKAMAQIAALVGNQDKSSRYNVSGLSRSSHTTER